MESYHFQYDTFMIHCFSILIQTVLAMALVKLFIVSAVYFALTISAVTLSETWVMGAAM